MLNAVSSGSAFSNRTPGRGRREQLEQRRLLLGRMAGERQEQARAEKRRAAGTIAHPLSERRRARYRSRFDTIISSIWGAPLTLARGYLTRHRRGCPFDRSHDSNPGPPMTPPTVPTRLVSALAAALLVACASSKDPKTAPTPAPNGSATTVNGDAINQSPGDPIEKVLMTRSAGVWVGRGSDGTIAVRIRGGSSSLYGNNEPLYILDGSPFTPGPEGALTGINPYDIESIKVLKDPAELSMYGARGANGVIIIKTKQKR